MVATGTNRELRAPTHPASIHVDIRHPDTSGLMPQRHGEHLLTDIIRATTLGIVYGVQRAWDRLYRLLERLAAVGVAHRDRDVGLDEQRGMRARLS